MWCQIDKITAFPGTSIVLQWMCGGDKSMNDKGTPILSCSKRYNRQRKIGPFFSFFFFPTEGGAGNRVSEKYSTFSKFEE